MGFSCLDGAPPVGKLASLFVDPMAIGAGYGKALLEHTLRVACAEGFCRRILDADPGAAPFSPHFGATRIGTSPSGSIPGRDPPLLEFTLDKT